MAARAVTPPRGDDHMVALMEARRLQDNASDLVDDAGDLVAQRDRGLDVSVGAEIAVHELDVGPAHPAGLDLDEVLVGRQIRNGNVLQN
jgi:hypothetical protein